ncbi:MAG: hypothetical protein NVS3B18_01710 [Candidatus Dormibacteria bacterium]
MRTMPSIRLGTCLLAGGAVLAVGLAVIPRPTGTPGPAAAPAAGPSTDLTPADLQNAASGCGLERWAIKVASDSQRGLVSTVQHQTSIAALRALPAPATLPRTRIQPTEVREYVVGATLTRYKIESDGDLHLILADSAGRTLIVELADPACANASRFRTEITAVRRQFMARFTPTGSYQRTRTPIRVRGIGFFDYQHGQAGVAPNGIELHPVLGLGFPS